MIAADKGKPKILSENLFPVVGIGASAGGLEAFKKFIPTIPEHSGMAYILVQHLHPGYESSLPEILQRITPIPVVEISDNVEVKPDHIYVIPSNKMLVATDGILQLSPRLAKDKINLPIDIFFSSLAEVHQSHAIGVVLSGTGSDGTAGLRIIKEHGGITFAQDPATASYDGMPQHAINASIVDFIIAPENISGKLMELQQSHKISNKTNENDSEDKVIEDAFRQVLALLRANLGVDFNFYKQTTVRRRIIRRMVMLETDTITNYVEYLKNNRQELDILLQDLLIPVTSFFRDKPTFETICNTVVPEIIRNKKTPTPIRIWIAGCSTGQEAFSIAICLHEVLGENEANTRVQIFASDLSEKAIKVARAGIYSTKEMEGISEFRLEEFFDKTADGNYQVKKPVRDMCVFAVHNLLKDPPFAKMDLISCRNVLIYFDPFLQKKALSIFHYALNDKGVLLLGKSESLGNSTDLFLPFGNKDKLYTRKLVPGRFTNIIRNSGDTDNREKDLFIGNKDLKSDDFQKNADEVLLSKYTPVGVIVNEQFDIVQFRGLTGEYLQPSPGKASLNVLKMCKEGLAFEIRSALHKAKATQKSFTKSDIPINNGKKLVTIEAIPLLNTVYLHFLILFKHKDVSNGDIVITDLKSKVNNTKLKKDQQEIRIQQLEKELSSGRKDMLSITEDQEAVNEELQSANEELLSGREELQSLNEELETSKEELQSINEELVTVNLELKEDIRGRKIKEQADETFKILANAMPQKMWTADGHGDVNYFNQQWYDFTHKTFDDLKGAGWEQIIHPDDLSQNQKIWESAVRTGIDFELEHRFRCYDGSYRWHLSRGLAQKNDAGKVILWIGTNTDIHEQKMKEQQKDQFIGIASHEMKTPLTMVKAYLQLMELAFDDQNSTAYVYAKKANQSVERLNDLITELLDVSKIQNGKLNYNITSFYFDEMIDHTIENFQHTSPTHTIVKTGGVQQQVVGDKERLQQVVINLLSNAIKYSPGKTNVFIDIKIVDGIVNVSVKDEGIGIAPNHLSKIFERYYRVEDHAIRFQGLGVGLYISSEIIQRHNGKIWATSEVGKGSTFSFSIPVQTAKELENGIKTEKRRGEWAMVNSEW